MPLRQCEWVVYAKRPFSGPEAVLAYLSRYTHRVAISNSRLVACDERGVTFRWKDYRSHGHTRYKTMTLMTEEFMRRFLLHVLPSGFHRIRHYGLLANANRKTHIATAREVLHQPPRLPLNPATTALLTASGPPSCAGTAALRCSSSRLSHARSTSADRRHLQVRHEHPLLTPKTFPVSASSNQADTNAHGHCRGYPAFLHATTAKIRILPPRHCKPQRRGRRIGPAIKLAEPTASVQIPIAHRFR